ncbi:unnamed protein product [Rotaria sordida]|uniref:dCMP deaminase n=1 Tax=Rotaria sordida TaxID=392033 RepID=A0A818LY24_9BILA|nr:unnamed protein product [Rotaria sordida]
MLIIGLIGSLSSGKHLIADILHKQYDFVILEYKDFKKKKDHAAEECLSKAKETWPKNVVILGINSLKAMIEIHDNPQFFPIAIEGPLIIRFQRQKHAIINSLEKFVQLDDYLMFGINPNEQCIDKILENLQLDSKDISPLHKCMDICHLRLINDTNDRMNLEKKLADLLSINSKDQQLTTTKLLCPSWDQYFLMLAWITASHGNCVRHRVGCIIADTDLRIIATGYNGTPGNIKACDQGGCKRCWNMSIEHGERLDECICIHAEESALFEAGRRLCQNATLYVTHNPCRQCSKKITQNGIKRVVYTKEYPSSLEDVRQLFEQANIEFDKQNIESIPLLRLSQ